MENPILELNTLMETYVNTFNKKANISPFSPEQAQLSSELKSLQKKASALVLYLYGYEEKDGYYQRRIPVKRVVENPRIRNLAYDSYKEIDFLPRCGFEYEDMYIENVERFYPDQEDFPYPVSSYAIFRLTLNDTIRNIYRYVYYRKTERTPEELKYEMLIMAGMKPLAVESMEEFVKRYNGDIREICGNDGYWYYTYIEDGAVEVVSVDSGNSLSTGDIINCLAAPIIARMNEEERTRRKRRGRFKKIYQVPRAGKEFKGRHVIRVERMDAEIVSAPFNDNKHVIFMVTYRHIDNAPDTDFLYLHKEKLLDYKDLVISQSGAQPDLQEGYEYFRRRVDRYVHYVKGTDGYFYYFYHDYEDNMAAMQEWTGEFLSREEIDEYLGEHKLNIDEN